MAGPCPCGAICHLCSTATVGLTLQGGRRHGKTLAGLRAEVAALELLVGSLSSELRTAAAELVELKADGLDPDSVRAQANAITAILRHHQITSAAELEARLAAS